MNKQETAGADVAETLTGLRVRTFAQFGSVLLQVAQICHN